MLYFSELKRRKVYTEDQVYVGYLKDVIFLATEAPTVTKLVVQSSVSDPFCVPIQFVKRINGSITLSKGYEVSELQENELYVGKNLLDMQIIDIKGNKIVRVNDVVIQDKPNLYLAGVDIGFLGILRWLKVEKFVFNVFQFLGVRLTSHFLSWGDIQPLELIRGKVKLKQEQEKVERIPPEDLADHLEKTNIRDIKRIISLLDEKYAAEVVGNLNVNYQNAYFKQIDPDSAAKIMSFIDPDEAADILLTLSQRRREAIIARLNPRLSKKLQYLLKISTTPIGEVMTTEFLTVSPKSTVSEVLKKIRKETGTYSFVSYVYVVNQNNELVGVANLHEIIMQEMDTVIYKFMAQNVAVVHLTTPKEIAIKKLLKYQLFALPVIDNDKHIIGIVTFDDFADSILERFD